MTLTFTDLHQSIILAYTERRLRCNQSNVSQRLFDYKLIQDVCIRLLQASSIATY